MTNKMVGKLFEFLTGLRNRHFFLLDGLIFGLMPILALGLRLDGFDRVARFGNFLLLYTVLALIIRLSVFWRFGLYARYWRYASIGELAQLAYAVAMSTAGLILIFLVPWTLWGIPDFPRSLPFIDAVLVFIAVGGLRYSVRFAEQERLKRRHRRSGESYLTRVAIFGAGEAGQIIVREMRANPQLNLEPIAFLDDDPRKHHTLIHGVPVIGGRGEIATLAREGRVDLAIIAMPTTPGKTIRHFIELCEAAGVRAKTIPGIYELLSGRVSVGQIRNVDIEDLLRREPVQIQADEVIRMIRGKRVLVTGAGGSIGSELCRQIARAAPAQLLLLGHGENSIFQIYHELLHQDGLASRLTFDVSRFTPDASPFIPLIADIRDLNRLRAIFAAYRPQIVFHAAAHKHVHLMEENVEEAVTNNVLGTQYLLQVAADLGVESLIFISSDKAVNPTSILGATKRLAELLVQDAAAQTGRCFVTVRFGNVLGSRGSVVPLFKQQIARGGPVTVTHPEARRYFMTIPEAVQLVLQAMTLGKGGEIFVLDMGEPVKILDLAQDLIRLSGLEVGEDIEIRFIGLRPGEKLVEELFAAHETCLQTVQPKILMVQNRADPARHNGRAIVSQELLALLFQAAQKGQTQEIRALLQELVPEYQPMGLAASFQENCP